MTTANAVVSSDNIEDLPTEPAASRAEGIANRRRALELGHVYYLGPACKHGHGGRRYTDPKRKAQTGRCVECKRKYERTPERKAYMRKRQRTPEYKAYRREYMREYRPEYNQRPERKEAEQKRIEERAELSEDGGITFHGAPCGKCGGTRYYVSNGNCVSCSQEYYQRCAEERAELSEDGGLTFLGSPCGKCGGTRYYVSNGKCVSCTRKHRRTPEYKSYQREYMREYHQRRREEHAELSEDGGLTFLGSPCGKCGGTRYYVSNGACVSCQVVVANGRRALEESWEDTWDTADWLKASALHEEAAARSRRTGVAHEVDHIVPLAKGGAHHPDNMQIISAEENRAKGAKDWAEEDHLAWLLGD